MLRGPRERCLQETGWGTKFTNISKLQYAKKSFVGPSMFSMGYPERIYPCTGLKVVGEVKKVGKSRNFHPKVGKSRNFSVFKVGKSRNFISVFVTSLYTGTSYMLVSFVDFEANYLIFQNCTFYTQSVSIEEPYCVLLIANYCLRTEFRLNWAAFLAITCNVAS